MTKFTKISNAIETKLQSVLTDFTPVSAIAQRIHDQGGKVFLVGGAVRDLMLGLQLKDLDCEVHGLELEKVENILQDFGHVNAVGKSFGVLRVADLDIDWSLPRVDNSGRKPHVQLDPFMSIEQAFRRRDLTMNAMGIDLTTYELVDPFHGLEDIRNRVLRTPDPKFFVEDPLRFFRVMQFIARFDMKPDQVLQTICKNMNVQEVSVERIELEFEKMWLRSQRPSLGLRWLRELERVADILPELAALIDVPQNPEFHPEGDGFEHTMQAVDGAALLEYVDDRAKIIMVSAALCHDLGKAVTTEYIKGAWRSYGHDAAGVPLAKALLRRITRKKYVIDTVAVLVRYHMLPVLFVKDNAGIHAYKRLASKVAPDVTLYMLAQLSLADKRGRNPDSHMPFTHELPAVTTFMERAEQAGVLRMPEEPILQGKDLLDSVKPGPELGELVRRAYEIQIEEGIRDKELLKKRVLEQYMK